MQSRNHPGKKVAAGPLQAAARDDDLDLGWITLLIPYDFDYKNLIALCSCRGPGFIVAMFKSIVNQTFD